MATPALTKHSLPGVLGQILIDVRSAGRKTSRPAVVVVHGFKVFKDWGMFPHLAERLARAGFTAVTFNLSGSGVHDALMSGALNIPVPSTLALVGHSRGGGTAVLQTAQDSRVRSLVTWAAISRVERWPEDQRSAWRARGQTEIQNARTGQILPLY